MQQPGLNRDGGARIVPRSRPFKNPRPAAVERSCDGVMTVATQDAGESREAAVVIPWHSLEPDAIRERLGTDLESGLTAAEAAARLQQYGPNMLQKEAKPSVLAVALEQVRDPMNIMLIV